ncbi:protein FLC EXPRESSOR [Punica granatum]|uniref:Uncharacterized protein n=2 Tax=Punica granatum TaxID=22663 RepID=A0A218W1M9_PUNGR|nr:protein FLC EXPRESSOR [Punica granatum]OWM66665.1 hypothetical protein CDL15_Pgr010316 [Punica granatum]PKI66577.1 hypothetical protein CRG98_013021 [Punica granatum]
MAGRDYPPPLSSGVRLRHPMEDPRLLPRHAPATSRSLHVAALEDRIAAQHREIQSLLVDNQRLAATHVALKQDFSIAQQELRLLMAAAGDVKAERDAEVREVHERSLKLEAEVRVINTMAKELAQVRADVQKLAAEREGLEEEWQAADAEIARARADSEQEAAMKAEIEALHQDIQRGRTAIELEKKTHHSNLEHSTVMERNMNALAREIEKLRSELTNAEKRARASAAVGAAANAGPGCGLNYGNPEVGFGGSPFPDPYTMHQVQSSVSGASPYAVGAKPHRPYRHTRDCKFLLKTSGEESVD